ncbi:MAG: tRNA (cmo5U34)-methyltransferase [Beijerinckiaceae bacterium]|nr:MAG: tRNA (cmo5U34)-methyltransferase [Beijerinckiaceae bacterium]
MSEPLSGSFFDAWDTYQKVVAGDYMFHREIGVEMNRVLRARFDARSFSFLDLGCGDAAALAPLLEGLPIQRYKGVDLSETALALAAENLKALPCPVELTHAHILAGLTGDVFYDVIYSSFALHHLPTAQKAEFFQRAAQRLHKGGLLLLVDVLREEDETLEVYHKRYCGWLRSNFSALNGDEKDLICDHIDNDLPEPRSVLEAQAQAAGPGITLHSARYGWHWLLCFTPAQNDDAGAGGTISE